MKVLILIPIRNMTNFSSSRSMALINSNTWKVEYLLTIALMPEIMVFSFPFTFFHFLFFLNNDMAFRSSSRLRSSLALRTLTLSPPTPTLRLSWQPKDAKCQRRGLCVSSILQQKLSAASANNHLHFNHKRRNATDVTNFIDNNFVASKAS